MSSVIILNVTPCFSYSFSGSDKLVIMFTLFVIINLFNVYNFTTFCMLPIGVWMKLYCCVGMCDTVQLVRHACSSTWLSWQRKWEMSNDRLMSVLLGVCFMRPTRPGETERLLCTLWSFSLQNSGVLWDHSRQIINFAGFYVLFCYKMLKLDVVKLCCYRETQTWQCQ